MLSERGQARSRWHQERLNLAPTRLSCSAAQQQFAGHRAVSCPLPFTGPPYRRSLLASTGTLPLAPPTTCPPH